MPGQDIPPFALGTSDLFDMTNNKQGYIYLHAVDGFTFLENVPEKPKLCPIQKQDNCKEFEDERGCECTYLVKTYERALAEAIEKRMVIGNPEVIENVMRSNGLTFTTGPIIPWPGTWEYAYMKKVSETWILCLKSEYKNNEDFKKVVILSPPKEERNKEEISKQFDWMTPEKAERLSKPVNSFNGPKEKAIDFIELLIGDLTRSAYAQGYIDKTERRGMKYLEWQSKSEPVVSQDQEEQLRKGWILSRERMPDFDGEYLIYGFMHEECGNVHPFQKVVTCRFNQWVKSDVGEQMTYWRPLLPPPIIKSIEDHP